MKLSKTSLVLLLIQLLLVSAVAAKYLYQRWRCPRVWTRAVSYDPELPMRGRYLAMQVVVDGCRSTLPSAKLAEFPRNLDGTTRPDGYAMRWQRWSTFPAELKVEGGKLLAIRLQNPETPSDGVKVEAPAGAPCEQLRLQTPVDFYLPEHAQIPARLGPGQELWIELTVPPKGAPRPLQLAMKEDGAWKPLGLQ